MQGTAFITTICTFLAENYIDGVEFSTLTENEVKAMVPPIGLARKVMRLLPHRQVILTSLLKVSWLVYIYSEAKG